MPVISTITTSGTSPRGARRRPAERSTSPSRTISFSSDFSAILAGPLMPKAWAISRLPTLRGLLRMKSRTSAFEGRAGVLRDFLRMIGSVPFGDALQIEQPRNAGCAGRRRQI
jgi:hypothetical protein